MGARRVVLVLAGINALLVIAQLAQLKRASAASDPEVVRARAFELVDEHGRVHAQLNVEPGGEAVLRLRDSKGEIRVKLGADKEGSGLLLLNGSTEPGVHLLAKTGEASITLTGEAGKRRVLTP